MHSQTVIAQEVTVLYLKRNVPGWERAARLAAGLAVAGLAIAFARTPLGTWLGIAGGAVFAVTGLIGYCPMCAMIGRKPTEAGNDAR